MRILRPMMSWVHGVMLLVFLSACTMVGPDFVQPTADVSKQWLEAKNERVKTEPPDFKNWWKVVVTGFVIAVVESL